MRSDRRPLPVARTWTLTVVGCLVLGSSARANDPLLGDPFLDSPERRAAIEEAEGRLLQPLGVQPFRVAENPTPAIIETEQRVAALAVTLAQPDLPVGLNGVIGMSVPQELGVETLYLLDEAWWDWADQTSAALTQLYSGQLDIPAQYETLNYLKGQAQIIEREAAMVGSLQQQTLMSVLAGRLHRRLELFTVILNDLSSSEHGMEQVISSAYGEASMAWNELQGQLTRMRGHQPWMDYIEAANLEAAIAGQGHDPSALETISRVHEKLATRHRLGQVQADFLSRTMFVNLETALEKVVATSTMPVGVNYQDALRLLAADLVQATEQYQLEPTSAAAATIRQSLAQWKAMTPDQGRAMDEVLSKHYFNYNVRLAISEGLMNRLAGEQRREGSRIRERALGADVSGYSCTTTDVRIDFRPSSDVARFTLVVNGRVRANTQADVHCASVYSNGFHCFRAEKDVCFDGFDFCLNPARVGARANNQMVDASTTVSCLPLVGRVADNFALSQAEARKAETDAYTASTIRRQVASRLNREVNQQFRDAPYRLESDLYGPLREYGLMPETIRMSTTEDLMLARARLMEPHEVAGNLSYLPMNVPGNGLVVQLHESAMNNGTDRMELAGQTKTESEVREELEQRLSDILGREVNFPEPAAEEGQQPQNNTLIFAEEDPVRFVFENDTVFVILRAGLVRDTGNIPTKKITVPLSFSIEDEGIVVRVRVTEAGNPEIRVEPAAPTTPAAHLREAPIMRGVIQRSIQDHTIENRIPVEFEDRKIDLQVTSIRIADGWVSFTAE